ncbi:MAG: Co2+/Mg2+ efflux protein ApaG [Rickettsiales bacterium]
MSFNIGSKTSATTNSITVSAIPMFLEDQSSSQKEFFVWAYNIEIVNQGVDAVKLTNRHWQVVDANGQLIEVVGEGVVGEQPVIEPLATYRYSSGTYLKTPSGMMYGTYTMHSLKDDEVFEVKIPGFSLDSPYDKHTLS